MRIVCFAPLGEFRVVSLWELGVLLDGLSVRVCMYILENDAVDPGERCTHMLDSTESSQPKYRNCRSRPADAHNSRTHGESTCCCAVPACVAAAAGPACRPAPAAPRPVLPPRPPLYFSLTPHALSPPRRVSDGAWDE